MKKNRSLLEFVRESRYRNFFRIIKKTIYFLISIAIIFLKLPISCLVYLLLVLLRPIILIRIGELESRAIGHFALPVEIYLSERDVQTNIVSKSIDLFYFNKKICNKFIAKKWNTYFYIFPRIFLETLYHFLLIFKRNSKHLVPYRHWKTVKKWQLYDIYGVLKKSKTHIDFSENEITLGNFILREMGLDSKKIIAFHARDPSYREGKYAKPGYRDSDINNYLMGASSVNVAGYAAVRIGRIVNAEISCSNTIIYDYANSIHASDFMDAYLLSKIDLLVCSGSGIESLALCFRKPLVCVNLAEWATLHFYESTQYLLFIPKKYFWISNNSPLTMREIINVGVNKFGNEEEYILHGVYVKENTPTEINDAVIEALQFLDGSHYYTDIEKKMQEKFQLLVGLHEGSRLLIPIGKKFLKENQYLINV